MRWLVCDVVWKFQLEYLDVKSSSLFTFAMISRIFSLFNKAFQQQICMTCFVYVNGNCHQLKARCIKNHDTNNASCLPLFLVINIIPQQEKQIFVVNFFPHNDKMITIRSNFLVDISHSLACYLHSSNKNKNRSILVNLCSHFLWATSLIVYDNTK